MGLGSGYCVGLGSGYCVGLGLGYCVGLGSGFCVELRSGNCVRALQCLWVGYVWVSTDLDIWMPITQNMISLPLLLFIVVMIIVATMSHLFANSIWYCKEHDTLLDQLSITLH